MQALGGGEGRCRHSSYGRRIVAGTGRMAMVPRWMGPPSFHAIHPIHHSHPSRWMGLPETTRGYTPKSRMRGGCGATRGAEPSESYMKKKLRCFTRLSL